MRKGSDELNLRLSEALKGKPKSEAHKAKLREVKQAIAALSPEEKARYQRAREQGAKTDAALRQARQATAA